MTADLSPDGDEDRIETARIALRDEVADLVIERDARAHRFDAADLRQQIGAGQAIGGYAELHHAAGYRPGIPDFDGVTQPREMIGGGKTARPRADDQHPFSARRRIDWERPVLGRGEVAEIPLDRMNLDGGIDRAAIARALAGVIADATVHRRQRVIADEGVPGGAKLSCLRKGKPSLDVLSGRASIVAGRQEVDIDWPPAPKRTRPFRAGEVRERGHVGLFLLHRVASVLDGFFQRDAPYLSAASASAGRAGVGARSSRGGQVIRPRRLGRFRQGWACQARVNGTGRRHADR